MNEDHIQHDLAYRVYGRMDPETDRSKIDIWTILTIAQIIIKVVQAIKHCQENREGVIKTVKNPSIVQEAMLRAAVRKEMGFFKYFFRGRRYGKSWLIRQNCLKRKNFQNLPGLLENRSII